MGNIKILDGAMGTMLQASGLKPGELPEIWGLEHKDIVESIHTAYIKAGADVIYANTFCANSKKLKNTGCNAADVIRENLKTAKEAADKESESTGRKILVALDIGPIGELLEPLGTLKRGDAYNIFKEMIAAGKDADIIAFETFTDIAELRLGVLAAKENSALSVWATMSFEENGRTFAGTSAEAMGIILTGLGVDAVGINCSLGPKEILPIAKKLRERTDLPLIIKPNAGLPDPETGKYNIDAETFAAQMTAFEDIGVSFMGGCCGTTPEFIKKLKEKAGASEKEFVPSVKKSLCSAGCVKDFGGILVIGERVNPTGKKRFQQALKEHDMDYIAQIAIAEQEAGADLLDINVGLPGLDEAKMMEDVVATVQNVTNLPLVIDSSNPEAIEAGLRAFSGRAVINSVNGDPGVLGSILPLAKKYGAAVIGLTANKNGLAENAEQRIKIAGEILQAALSEGLSKDDLIIDCLTLTVSAQQEQAGETLKAIRYVTEEMCLRCALGVSNISFGLPERQTLTAAFLSQAIGAGLKFPIINPNLPEIMDVIYSCRALSGEDENCGKYIERFAERARQKKEADKLKKTVFSVSNENTAKDSGSPQTQEANKDNSVKSQIQGAVLKGLKSESAALVEGLLGKMVEMDIINDILIPALDVVGEKYESHEIFLPQLINAANAAGAGFDVIKSRIAEGGKNMEPKGTIILATVEGDIHDIGKNIVKVVLENYGYRVIDLGKDVPVQSVVDAAIKYDVHLIGLSALMTTTVESMRRTIEALRASGHECTVFVGGAVLTEEYAKKIGADYYTKDAKASADVAKAFFEGN